LLVGECCEGGEGGGLKMKGRRQNIERTVGKNKGS
jgi:hypothetical protein